MTQEAGIAVEERCSQSSQEAGNAVRRGGLPNGGAGQGVRTSKQEAVRHLSRSLRDFYSSSHYSDIDRIVLTGDGASLGLAEALQHALGAPAALAQPFAGMSVSPQIDAEALAADAPALALACGLAMRGFE